MVNLQDGILRKGPIPIFSFFLKKKNFHPCDATLIFILYIGDKIASCYTRKKYEIMELGLMHPEEVPTNSLNPGQVGYIACNMKQSSEGGLVTFFFSKFEATYLFFFSFFFFSPYRRYYS